MKLTKEHIFDKRTSQDIDSTIEPKLYLAKLVYDTYGIAIRDNTIDEIISIGMQLEPSIYFEES